MKYCYKPLNLFSSNKISYVNVGYFFFEIKHPLALARTHIFGHDEAIFLEKKIAGGPFHNNFTKMYLDIDTDKLEQKKIHRPHLY